MSTVDSQGRLNSTAAALLGLLRRYGPMTGGDLLRTAKLVIGDYWSVTRSQVYRELTALAARGFLEVGPPGPREARPYALTEEGASAFLGWLDDGPGEDTVRLPVLLSVGFGADLRPGRLAEILDDYERGHRAQLARYRTLEAELDAATAGVDAYVRATLSFGVAHEEAVLRWLEGLPAELRRPPAAERPAGG